MLEIVLAVVLIGLVVAAIQALARAPSDQKATIALVLVVLAAVGAAAGYFAASDHDQRTFYPIAGAIGGTMIAFAWISRKQKTWPKKS